MLKNSEKVMPTTLPGYSLTYLMMLIIGINIYIFIMIPMEINFSYKIVIIFFVAPPTIILISKLFSYLSNKLLTGSYETLIWKSKEVGPFLLTIRNGFYYYFALSSIILLLFQISMLNFIDYIDETSIKFGDVILLSLLFAFIPRMSYYYGTKHQAKKIIVSILTPLSILSFLLLFSNLESMNNIWSAAPQYITKGYFLYHSFMILLILLFGDLIIIGLNKKIRPFVSESDYDYYRTIIDAKKHESIEKLFNEWKTSSGVSKNEIEKAIQYAYDSSFKYITWGVETAISQELIRSEIINQINQIEEPPVSFQVLAIKIRTLSKERISDIFDFETKTYSKNNPMIEALIDSAIEDLDHASWESSDNAKTINLSFPLLSKGRLEKALDLSNRSKQQMEIIFCLRQIGDPETIITICELLQNRLLEKEVVTWAIEVLYTLSRNGLSNKQKMAINELINNPDNLLRYNKMYIEALNEISNGTYGKFHHNFD